MRVLVAMSGGVDSSVAAALALEQGHEVVGATMKLWGGSGDSGCCSLADVTDARRVADHLGIEHHVFNFTAEFDEHVVEPYVASHARGETPNPCAECNRSLKFGRLLERAARLGFDAVATGHHARVVTAPGGRRELRRGADPAKDQSYVLAMLGAAQLDRIVLPVGELDKSEVRARAAAAGLRTADKPDSQDVCFIASRTPGAGRRAFLAERIALHPGRVLDARSGAELGAVEAVELVTVGQRRGLGALGSSARFAVEVDVARRRVLVGDPEQLLTTSVELTTRTWTGAPLAEGSAVLVQTSAHGQARPGVLARTGIAFAEPVRRPAPGQLVACYVGDAVVGSGVVA